MATEPCPECKGYGWVVVDVKPDPQDPQFDRTIRRCPKCGSTKRDPFAIDGVRASKTYKGRPLFTKEDKAKMKVWPF